MTLEQFFIVYSAILSTLSAVYLLYTWIQSRKILDLILIDELDRLHFTNLSSTSKTIMEYGVFIDKKPYKISREKYQRKLESSKSMNLDIHNQLVETFQQSKEIGFPCIMKGYARIVGVKSIILSNKVKLHAIPSNLEKPNQYVFAVRNKK